MKVYRVFAQVSVGAWVDVVANSIESAQDKAENLEFNDFNLEPSSFVEIQQLEIDFRGEYDANE